MIAATVSSTSGSVSRLAASSAAKAASNPLSRVARVIAIALFGCCLFGGGGRLAQRVDPMADLLRPRLQCRPVDDEPRADVGDVLDLGEAVRLQGGAGLYQ